jgi:2-polyprenyl-6-methoxyphenol hydroxylase-like FAD-dependent oxidoreductase
MNEAQTDVLVVGAGPTGLTLASELLRHGLTVRIVDAAEAPSPWSRAVAVHARTLEVLSQMGCADALVARGQKLRGATLWSAGEALARVEFDELDTSFPYVLCLSQQETEAVLHDALAARGGAVERGVSLTSFRQDGAGVTARLARGGEELTARAAWIVGCDGAHSVVRKALDLPFEGSTYEERFQLADVKIDWDTRDDRITTYFADDGLVACFPLPGGRWRLVATDVGEAAEAPSADEVEALFHRRTGTGARLSDMVWSSRFRIHCRQVASYRDDRALLAGDAAHIHSPVGGQGMNTGVQDAHNLAWKLRLVHKGLARSKLLDTYHEERHAVGQSVLRGTDAATKAASVRNPLARGVRDEVARFLTSLEVVQQRVATELAELTVNYERSSLSLEHPRASCRGASAPRPAGRPRRWPPCAPSTRPPRPGSARGTAAPPSPVSPGRARSSPSSTRGASTSSSSTGAATAPTGTSASPPSRAPSPSASPRASTSPSSPPRHAPRRAPREALRRARPRRRARGPLRRLHRVRLRPPPRPLRRLPRPAPRPGQAPRLAQDRPAVGDPRHSPPDPHHVASGALY